METTSRKVHIAVALVFVLAPASTLTLAIDAQADRMENAFTEWVGKHSVESANLVIVRDGAILGTVGRGRLATSRPVGVASLSKAITGVCIVKLVEAHKLQFDADLGAVLAGRFKRHPPKDQRAQTITIAQLLTHTSLLGVSGRAILEALVAGQKGAEAMAELARGSLRGKIPLLRKPEETIAALSLD